MSTHYYGRRSLICLIRLWLRAFIRQHLSVLLRARLHNIPVMAHNVPARRLGLCLYTDFMISNGSHVAIVSYCYRFLMTVRVSVANIVLSLLQYYRKTCILSKCFYNIYIKCYYPRIWQLSENIGAILCACWVVTYFVGWVKILIIVCLVLFALCVCCV